MKYIYPAIFRLNKQENAVNVEVPDLPGCFTFGNNMLEAIEMARDAVSLWLVSAENTNIPIPEATMDYQSTNGIVGYIDVDTSLYRRRNDNKTVKKNLTIPAWLNVEAEKAKINFSQVLQQALKKELNISNR